MECVNQLRRRLFPASEPENYIVHNLRTSLSVAEHQRDTALDRLKHAEAELAGAQARASVLSPEPATRRQGSIPGSL